MDIKRFPDKMLRVKLPVGAGAAEAYLFWDETSDTFEWPLDLDLFGLKDCAWSDCPFRRSRAVEWTYLVRICRYDSTSGASQTGHYHTG